MPATSAGQASHARETQPAKLDRHALLGMPTQQSRPARPRKKVLPRKPASRYGPIMMITITNTKGGVGKSTLACHLAIWLCDRGKKVALIDADEQGSAVEWMTNAESAITVRVALKMEEIQKARAELLATHDVIVADAPGEEGEAANALTLLSDFAIVLLPPNKLDVRALKYALRTIRLAHTVHNAEKPQAVLALNFVRKRNAKCLALKEQLRQYGLRVAAGDIRRLDAIADSCDSAVWRMKNPRAQDAAADFDRLFSELFSDFVTTDEVANG
jgi:chromosome partitioning protein